MSNSLVSVIVPAWNAEMTIGKTLQSVASQTYSNMEILIVDDGSTDQTPTIAKHFCSGDRRARLIRAEHGGVASARNRGIHEARGKWIAPIDADDLWHPEKIERQLRLADQSPPNTGLIYNWFRKIDHEENVIEEPFAPIVEGNVLRDHLRWNFIANGSTPLIRASLLDEIKYDSSFYELGNQGCEDYLLQLQIAAKSRFACVKAFLTGYRVTLNNMSSDVDRMIRSHIQMYQILLCTLPKSERIIAEKQLSRYLVSHSLIQLKQRRWLYGFQTLRSASAHSLADASQEFLSVIVRSISTKNRPLANNKRKFIDYSPDEGVPLR